ncbi:MULTISPECIES: FAD/NAD(P)-binding protein [Streptomyces]|uniref:FAD/NAD(P)-binding protein n=1 Tax=Streptomyces lonegramiae TaxID=3075524 RepID=A0ABU2X7X9_9ACTN|nr:FAD/NAD(P)-binding protein [Streptomyces sp. DSM 41529]MDT0542011.1 FAD/NAD(P)-binding protein [Streptomyces sp. DSM 41529]
MSDRHGETAFRVTVVGAGAAGTLVCAALLNEASADGLRVRVDLVDPSPDTGRGVAYRTPDPRHLLNVPAGRMSATDDADDFRRWLSAREGRAVGPGEYVPRARYGGYLADRLRSAASDAAPYGSLRRVHDRAEGVRPRDGAVRLSLRGGAVLESDAAVLAIGHLAPRTGWAPPALRASGRFVADPWWPGVPASIPGDRDVLLVGTGLTMCDMARSLVRPGRTVYAVSTHGLLPAAHAPAPAAPLAPCPPPEVRSLAALERLVMLRAARARRVCGDWRPALDALRPHTTALWQRLSAAEQREFLRTRLRWWEVHRHRMPPDTHAAVRGALGTGGLRVLRGALSAEDFRVTASGEVRVRLPAPYAGWTGPLGAVVNCTGTEGRVTEAADPLVRGLLAAGLARPGPHALGFDTAPDGRLLPAFPPPGPGDPAPLWTLGSLRRGNLWETTAIPEIRVQANRIATAVVALLASHRPAERQPTTPYLAQPV